MVCSYFCCYNPTSGRAYPVIFLPSSSYSTPPKIAFTVKLASETINPPGFLGRTLKASFFCLITGISVSGPCVIGQSFQAIKNKVNKANNDTIVIFFLCEKITRSPWERILIIIMIYITVSIISRINRSCVPVHVFFITDAYMGSTKYGMVDRIRCKGMIQKLISAYFKNVLCSNGLHVWGRASWIRNKSRRKSRIEHFDPKICLNCHTIKPNVVD
jgi:hypothetical protein